MEKLHHIDSLRGVAILLVILVHTSQTVGPLPYALHLFAAYGQMGVQLFFLVSGFTLANSMDKRSSEGAKLKNFYIRRIFRVAPLYYFAILLYLILDSTLMSLLQKQLMISPQYTAINILSNLSFTHGFYPPANNNVVPGGWSIGTEMAFYLIFPLVYLLTSWVHRTKIALLFLLPVAALILDWSIQAYYTAQHDTLVRNNTFMYFNLSNQLPVFFMGVVAYFLVKGNVLQRVTPMLSAIIFIIFTAVSVFLMEKKLSFSFVLLPSSAAVSFIFLLNLFSRIEPLSPSWLQRIGQLSYSMYVFHFIFAWILTRQFLNPLISGKISPGIILPIYFMIVVICTRALAVVTERYVETTGIRIGKRLTS